MNLSLEEAAALAHSALGTLGFTQPEAATITAHLMDCELRGYEYSGLARIVSIAERLAASPAPGPMRVTRESPVSMQLDGGDRIGYLVAEEATRLALQKAAVSGIGAVGANRTWYTGMLSYYAERIVGAGMVAFVASNATPWVAPFGGSEPRFGTNPICMGFPGAEAPFIWDIGTSQIIHAEAVLAQRTGQLLPEGVAYNAAGAPTRDPKEALTGAFVNWGGHQGSGLGMVVQLFGILAGSPAQPAELRDFGIFVLAVRPDLFVDPLEFREEVTRYADLLRATRPLDIRYPVRVPFERSAACRAERRAHGSIDVPNAIYRSVVAVAAGG